MNTKDESNKLVVKTQSQRIIFLAEMQGQISDGQWENAYPQNHYIVWTSLDASQVVVGENIGRNFYALKDNYLFSGRELLEAVGDRILFKVKLALTHPELTEAIANDGWSVPDSSEDFATTVRRANEGEQRAEAEVAKWSAIGINPYVINDAVFYDKYTMDDLRADCSALRKACKTFNG